MRPPIGCQQAGGEMAARGMAADDERPAEFRQRAGRCTHLSDDRVDRHLRTEIIGGNSDLDAVRIQPTRAMAEGRTVQRLPVTTMDEDDDRPLPVTGKQIDGVTRTGPISNLPR